MFKHRSQQKELLDDIIYDNMMLKQNLDEMEMLNQWFGSKKLILNSMEKISKKYSNYFKENKIVIADLGCGNGDLLRSINNWAKKYNYNLELIGIDSNPNITQYALEKSTSHLNLKYETFDFLSEKFMNQKYDIILINNVCHHLSDDALIKLFKQLESQARFAVLISDLYRHWISYLSIKCLSKLLNFSYLTKNDGPLSVLRAFRKHELINLLERANITDYQIRLAWAFHWEIIISCQNNYTVSSKKISYRTGTRSKIII